MIKLICLITSVLFVIFWSKTACSDKDFVKNGQFLTLSKKDKFIIGLYMLMMLIVIWNMPIYAAMFSTISLPYLIISAITDKKTKLVYDTPFYVFCVVALIMESIQFETIQVSLLVIYLFAEMLAVLKLFGRGDRAMTVICGTIYFFYNPNATVIEALLVTCVMILIAEIFVYIEAVKERNLDGLFKLKESRPLGPSLCLSTFIILIKIVVENML